MRSFKQFFHENVGVGTKWVDGDTEITLQDVLGLSSEPEQEDPSVFEPLLIDVSRDPERIDNADLSFPIVVSTQGGSPRKILDGQHRIVKAMKAHQPIHVRYLDLDSAPEHVQHMFGENFKDGKKKGKSRPGRVKRSGASCKGSVTSLRSKAKKYGGEKGKMYHWCANMKGGKKK